MGRSTKFNAIVLTSVAAAGLGVAVAAAFSEPTENDDEIVNPVPDSLMNLAEGPGEIELPSLPTSKEEVLELYKKSKEPISKIFRIAGQMLVAPIAMIAIDAAWDMYTKSTELHYTSF